MPTPSMIAATSPLPLPAAPELPKLPGASALGALLGGALLVAGGRRGGLAGRLAALAGAGIVVTSLARPAGRALRRLGSERRRLRLHTTLHVDRPVDEVFCFVNDFENFPRLVRSLRSVVDYQDGRSHWAAATAAGRVLEWDAVVTKYVPRSVLAWESVPGSPVETSGLVRFTPGADGGTDLELELSYAPRETDLREAVFALLDLPRAEQLAAELARLPLKLRTLPLPARDESHERAEPEPAPMDAAGSDAVVGGGAHEVHGVPSVVDGGGIAVTADGARIETPPGAPTMPPSDGAAANRPSP